MNLVAQPFSSSERARIHVLGATEFRVKIGEGYEYLLCCRLDGYGAAWIAMSDIRHES